VLPGPADSSRNARSFPFDAGIAQLVERLIRNETGTTPDFQTLIETTLARMGLLPAPSPPFEYVLDKYLEERLASGRTKK
jgi:hypothetical protein